MNTLNIVFAIISILTLLFILYTLYKNLTTQNLTIYDYGAFDTITIKDDYEKEDQPLLINIDKSEFKFSIIKHIADKSNIFPDKLKNNTSFYFMPDQFPNPKLKYDKHYKDLEGQYFWVDNKWLRLSGCSHYE